MTCQEGPGSPYKPIVSAYITVRIVPEYMGRQAGLVCTDLRPSFLSVLLYLDRRDSRVCEFCDYLSWQMTFVSKVS